jgi:hypothetical protein
MKWYYWVLTCWIGLNVLLIAWLWVRRLLISRRAASKSIQPIMTPSSVVREN